MKKKFLIGSVLALLSSIGIYKFVSKQTKNKQLTDSADTQKENWTTANIPDLTGKVIIVTGGNSGIGFEAAKEFARKGAKTILACRNMDKAEAALAEIKAEIPNAPVEIILLDLASLASIHQFANKFIKKYKQLDVLVNNAGIMMVPYSTTEDGFESQIGTNHLGHFALTGLLIEVLLNTPNSRIVNISSGGHRMGKMDFHNLLYKNGKGYGAARAYGRSKLANLLFTYQLQRRFEAIGANAIAVAAHPGGSDTNLGKHLKHTWQFKLLSLFAKYIMQSAAMGALPTIRAAVDPDVTGGQYFGPNGFMEMTGYPIIVPSNAASHNKNDARQLWQISEELTGIHFSQLHK